MPMSINAPPAGAVAVGTARAVLWFDMRSRRSMRSLHSARAAPLACIACLVALSTVHAANEEHWLDVEGQIQYGYYTEDLRALGNLAAQLDAHADASALQSYYAALAYYRLALLGAGADRLHAGNAAEQCSASLEQSLKVRANWAEALALRGACSGL